MVSVKKVDLILRYLSILSFVEKFLESVLSALYLASWVFRPIASAASCSVMFHHFDRVKGDIHVAGLA